MASFQREGEICTKPVFYTLMNYLEKMESGMILLANVITSW